MARPVSSNSADTASLLYLNLDSRERKVEQACKYDLKQLEEEGEDQSKRDLGEQRARIIQDAPLSIARKRALTEKYVNGQSRRQSVVDKKERNQTWKHFKSGLSDFSKHFVVWRSSVKTVAGKFGGAVASYFVFLRWLFFLNLFITLLLFTFVVVPEIFVNQESIQQFYGVTQDNCTLAYLDSIDDSCKNNGSIDLRSCVENFLVGKGWIEETILFYGSYAPSFLDVNSTTLENFPGLVLSYNRPVAYMLTTVIYLAVCLIILIHYATTLFEKHLVYHKDKNPLKYSTLMFSGWDFSITREKTARYKKHNMFLNLQVELEADRGEIIRKKQHIIQKCSKNLVRVVIHLIVTVCNLCAYYLIYYATEFRLRADFDSPQLQEIVDLFLDFDSPQLQELVDLLPSITTVLLNNLLSNIFNHIVQYEDYTPSFEVFMTLVRISFLRLASLLVLLFSLYNNINCTEGSADRCGACAFSEDRVISCWETEVGQEFYKLTIIDLLVTALLVITWEYPRGYLSRRYKWARPLGNIEFELKTQVLNLVYSQAISWIGAFFCPFLPLITTVKLFVIFYLRKGSLLHNMRPSSRESRASNAGFFFVVMLIVTFLLCLIPVAYAFVTFQPSLGCGPFRGLQSSWDKVSEAIRGSPLPWLITIYSFIGTAPVVIGAISLLILVLYYQYSQSALTDELVGYLEKQARLEKKTKNAIRKKIREMRKMDVETRHQVGRTL